MIEKKEDNLGRARKRRTWSWRGWQEKKKDGNQGGLERAVRYVSTLLTQVNLSCVATSHRVLSLPFFHSPGINCRKTDTDSSSTILPFFLLFNSKVCFGLLFSVSFTCSFFLSSFLPLLISFANPLLSSCSREKNPKMKGGL